MRTIIIGDVHGCFEELKLLLQKIKFNKDEDELLFLGDLINKGPYPLEVLNFVIDNEYKSLMGNHELGFLKKIDSNCPLKGSQEALVKKMGDRLKFYIEKIRNFPFYIERDEFICVHGGLQPGVKLENQNPEIMTRIRTWDGFGKDLNNPKNPSWYNFYKEDKLVVYGHWAEKGLLKRTNTIGLDSGCVWGGSLSALILPERRIEQVSALKQYKYPLVS